MSSAQKSISPVLLAVLVIVTALSFLHFYGMIAMGANEGAMQSHAPCASYLQIASAIPQTGKILLSAALLVFALIKIEKNQTSRTNTELTVQLRSRFFIKIKPALVFIRLFRKGIIHPKLYV